MKDTASGYSLWLVPEGVVLEYLQGIILDLSMKYETPMFEPHVTLIGEMNCGLGEASEYASQIARRLRPFYVELGMPCRGDTYFKALFAEIKETPELMEANKIAQEVCGTKQAYKPHLSLLYSLLHGDLDEEVLRGTLHYLRNKFQSGGGFPVTTLFLYQTEGEPWHWHRIAGIKIRTNN